jgi:tetratricopeptide (TPR) repeat protein
MAALLCLSAASTDLESARDSQNRTALQQAIAELSKSAQKNPSDAGAQYRLALAQSYLAEVALELKDKQQAKAAAEAGILVAERAVSLRDDMAEYHRILGTLCGQVIPANLLSAFKYGKCAVAEIEKALQLDPKYSDAYLSRGIGNYYLPVAFGGGVEAAARDFQKAVELNPKSAEARLWLGIALRRMNRNAQAREAILKSLELNPRRIWAKKQLEKTPAQ